MDMPQKNYLLEENLTGVDNPYAEHERIEVTDQYMMGPSILVAPVFSGQNEREVILPFGNWYDFCTGEFIGSNETITIETILKKIPLFVKDGAIIPLISSADSSSNINNPAIEVRHYGTKENTYLLYNNHGESCDYEKGEYSLIELKVERKKNGKLSVTHKIINSGKVKYKNIS